MQQVAAVGGLTVLGCSSGAPKGGELPQPEKPVAKKRILILGGTGFIGPKTIDVALARGHHVTIFNRGKREKFRPLQVQVDHLYGNRDPELPADDEKGPDGKLLRPDSTPKGLEQLAGKQWDVVIDNSGFFPRHVKASAELLAPNVKQYVYISSISAYDEKSIPPAGGDETVKLAELADPKVETMGDQFQHYGGLKVACERAVQAALPKGACIVRPGYIVGPGDPTDRFTYWPVRISRGGEVAIPGAPTDPLQWIDVRDLAEWLVKLVEDGTTGSFNAVGPPQPAQWGDVVKTCVDAAKSGATPVWIPTAWFEANKVDPGELGFPIWSPPTGEMAGFHRWSNDRAEQAGLTFRSAPDTIKALLAWWPGEVEARAKVKKDMEAKGMPVPPPVQDPQALRAGPKADKEAELLAKFKKK